MGLIESSADAIVTVALRRLKTRPCIVAEGDAVLSGTGPGLVRAGPGAAGSRRQHSGSQPGYRFLVG